jgi:hypothetical protein
MVWLLEMHSTADWSDVRYREYTSSKAKALAFERVPKIKFTDSGHGIVPFVREHKGRRQPTIKLLADHVNKALAEMRWESLSFKCQRSLERLTNKK